MVPVACKREKKRVKSIHIHLLQESTDSLGYILQYERILTCFANQPAPDIIVILTQRLPHYDITNKVVSGHACIFEWKTLASVLVMTTPMIPILIGILILRKRIVAILSTHTLSENTKVLHNDLLKALTYQAVLPCLFSVSLLCYICTQFGLYRHPILESFLVMPLDSLAVLSPLMSLCFIRPYRRLISKRLSSAFKWTSYAVGAPSQRTF
ncbi:hypothetical protein COOONC_02978 [Cooperia oncophora]